MPVGRRFATVLTSAAGHPLDKTYYQTVKGMVTPLDILEPGGTLIVASACSEGFGSPEFRAAQARLVELGPDAFLQTLLAKRFADVDEWQTEMQLKSMRAGRVQLYTTGLDDEERRLTGVENVDVGRGRARRRARARRRSGDRGHSRRTVCRPRRRLTRPALPPPASLAIHLDLVGGIAGDMFVAAMVDALPALAAPVLAELAAVQPARRAARRRFARRRTAACARGASASRALRRRRPLQRTRHGTRTRIGTTDARHAGPPTRAAPTSSPTRR